MVISHSGKSSIYVRPQPRALVQSCLTHPAVMPLYPFGGSVPLKPRIVRQDTQRVSDGVVSAGTVRVVCLGQKKLDAPPDGSPSWISFIRYNWHSDSLHGMVEILVM